MPQSRPSRATESAARRTGALSLRSAASPALRAQNAAFRNGSALVVPPFSVELERGSEAMLEFASARAARVAARIAAGIVRATEGTLLLGDYDPRIQPVHAKRRTGYVPHAGDFGAPGSLTVALQAALFEVALGDAQRAVRETLAALGRSDAEAHAVALALIRPVHLLVVERPSGALRERLHAVLPAEAALLLVAMPSPPP